MVNEIYVNEILLVEACTLSLKRMHIKIRCTECFNFCYLKCLVKSHCFNRYVCAACRNKKERNPMYGRRLTDAQKKAKSESMMGNKNHMYGVSFYSRWLEKYGEEEAKRRLKEKGKKHSRNSSGCNNPFYGKRHPDHILEQIGQTRAKTLAAQGEEGHLRRSKAAKKVQADLKEKDYEAYIEAKRKAARASNASRYRYKMSTPEILVDRILTENNIEHEYSFIMGEPSIQFDFIIKCKRILLEVDGDFWHGNPSLYKEENLNHIQLKNIENDRRKEDIARSYGYTVLRIWEADLRDKTKIRKLINEILSAPSAHNKKETI